MELNIIHNSFEIETLSGRRINIEQNQRNETIASVKKRISTIYENDGEIGNDGHFYLLHSNGKQLNDDDLINESLINNSKERILVRRNRYSCFIEHMINEHVSKPWLKWVSRVLCVCFSMLLIAAFAQISFYLPHARNVPVTLQTLGIFIISSLLGWKMGVSTIVLYLLCGLAGAPFFTNQGHGVAYMNGSTSGYLYGFIVAAFVVGYASELGSDRVYFFNWKSTLLSMIIGNVVIYIVGIPVLASKIGWSSSIKFGLVPFLVGDTLKIIIATVVIPSIWKLIAYLSNRNIIIKSQIPLDFLSSNEQNK
ncbi:hypothetical protein DICPUDRAFT_79107 [Dictyostelium purpureum]|uniref:Uncharacterized protein n=1 Tax=Dictyostelium purpureum TaxID=5786 RepID=F0ZLK9_DICPU|nr:uncharacterized protein DICPUDRAFT_79107 [Dictyostelium purpureum]EGC35172.1 hypothetical protein DICPUDRAFT_79107 [Dictyostelium purpureum]|eukprot:XP_003288310.1 hypothetical protein DICPUDRAFT_79107 [Dictyostelium purpureum]